MISNSIDFQLYHFVYVGWLLNRLVVKQEEATEIDTMIMIVTVADVAAVVTTMTSE